MSHSFYNLQWQQAMEKLSEQIEIENPPVRLDEKGKPVKEVELTPVDFFQHFACLYMRYVQIFSAMDDCYDQIVHPQKRRDIKIVLEVVMARICQVKGELFKYAPPRQQVITQPSRVKYH